MARRHTTMSQQELAVIEAALDILADSLGENGKLDIGLLSQEDAGVVLDALAIHEEHEGGERDDSKPRNKRTT